MTMRRALGLLASLAIIAPARADPPVPPAPAPATFVGFQLGAKVDPLDKNLVAAPDEGGFKTRKPVRYRGRKMDALVQVTDGRLMGVRLRAAVKGAKEAQLVSWVAALCTSLGATVEERSPSPLGTPTSGKDWDPVILTRGRCEGTSARVHISVTEERASGKTFSRAEVEVLAELEAAGN